MAGRKVKKVSEERKDEDDDLFRNLIEIVKEVIKNPGWVGLAAVGIGVLIKQNPEHLKLVDEYREEFYVKEGYPAKGISEKDFCAMMKRQNPNTKICVKVRDWDAITDVFPWDLFGLVPKQTGEAYVSDLLILAGLFAIGGPALGEILKLKLPT